MPEGNQLSCNGMLGAGLVLFQAFLRWAKLGQDSKFLCLNKLKSYEKLMQVTKTAISPLPRPRPGAARTDSATVLLTTYYCISGSRGNNGVIAPVFFSRCFEILPLSNSGFLQASRWLRLYTCFVLPQAGVARMIQRDSYDR